MNTTPLHEQLSELPWQERLKAVLATHPEGVRFATSFSLEDQVITWLIASQRLPVRIFTLDTGRHFEQVHATHQRTIAALGVQIETYYPDTAAVEQLIRDQGINGFYDSTHARHACCHVRKVEPLARALAGASLWISGLRREHSAFRESMPMAKWDDVHQLTACYPLLDVDEDTLWETLKTHDIPFNPMYEEGYPSIGCAPCTRAVQQGESPRAGRWWWEQEGNRECGLHIVDGKLVRGNK